MPDMTRRDFRAAVGGGDLVGWVQGSGREVLLLHGGPGLSFTYLDSLADELGPGYEIAAYQQRGLAPSTARGPYDVNTQVSDVAHVLDALGWHRATVVGHSWGGHLAAHVAAALGDRLDGVLIVDPLGAVGDGGEKEFEAAIFERTPADVRARAQELDERAMRGEGTEDQMIESLRLVWPAYFPSWDAAPPMPDMTVSVEAYAETFESVHALLPALEQALPTLRVPVGFVAGDGSPMPLSASTDSAAKIPGAWVEVAEGAGHFPWYEAPGSVRRALERLVASS
jgi:pimeloyl-ACP methyl ester carboxylesterase